MAKFLVITGGTKGIGLAVVNKFAAAGFDICTCSRRQEDLDKLLQEVKHKHRAEVFTFKADLSSESGATNFTSFVNSLSRPVDVLVNNAGTFVPGQITQEPDGILETMINSNLYSAYHTTRGLLPAMMKSKSGHIFNMCSIASIEAYPNGGSYTISKFALLGFSKVLREELKSTGIRVTAILPGATLTASWEGTTHPEERFMRSEDVADAIHAAYGLSGRSVVEEMIIRPQLGDL